MWMPSHLAVYISHHLSLHPRLSDDITAFVRTSRLDGRTFIRLKEVDLEEMGVNVVWRKALLEAKNTLRREALGGKVFWGFEGVRYGDGEGWDSEEQPSRKPKLERRPSMVEGSDQEEEEGKEEWKRSWRMLQGGRRVRGMVSKFDDVVEASREGTPNTSPTKDRSLRIESSDDSQPKRRSRIFPQSPYPAPGGHDRGNSTESSTSTASIDSGSGSGFSLDDAESRSRSAHSNAFKTPPSFSTNSLFGFTAHSSAQQSHLRSYFSPDSNSNDTSTFSSPHHPRPPIDSDADQVDSPTTLATENDPLNGGTPPSALPAPDYQSKISAHSRPYGLVRRPSEKAREALLLLHRDVDRSVAAEQEGEEGGAGVERTLRPSSEGTASGGFGGEKRMGLGELFGIEVPSSAGAGGKKDGLEEVVEMEVGARGGKKGSVVMVKSEFERQRFFSRRGADLIPSSGSQLAALSRRMAEYAGPCSHSSNTSLTVLHFTQSRVASRSRSRRFSRSQRGWRRGAGRAREAPAGVRSSALCIHWPLLTPLSPHQQHRSPPPSFQPRLSRSLHPLLLLPNAHARHRHHPDHRPHRPRSLPLPNPLHLGLLLSLLSLPLRARYHFARIGSAVDGR